MTVNLKKMLSLQLDGVYDVINQNAVPIFENNYIVDQFFLMFDWHTNSGGFLILQIIKNKFLYFILLNNCIF